MYAESSDAEQVGFLASLPVQFGKGCLSFQIKLMKLVMTIGYGNANCCVTLLRPCSLKSFRLATIVAHSLYDVVTLDMVRQSLLKCHFYLPNWKGLSATFTLKNRNLHMEKSNAYMQYPR